MLLVDNNLSFRLVKHLEKIFPGSRHVVDFNLDEQTDDVVIWRFSKDNGYTILTKDSDFEAMSRLYGCPPKIVQLKCGNKTTTQIINFYFGERQ